MKSGSEKLKEAGQAVRSLAERREVGKAIRAELGEIAESVAALEARVAEIEDLYAIDFGSDIDARIAQAEQLWETAAPGAIAGADLLPLRRASPVLSTLFLKGIDIRSAYKFSPAETELARQLGTNFDRTSDVLRALRRAKRNPDDPDEYSALVPMRRSLDWTLTYLEDAGIIEGRRILCRNKLQKWAPFSLKYLRDEPETNLLVVYAKADPARVHLMHGEWLNCYVYDIIGDQLMRHEIPYELYTNVSYSAPKDLIRAASEFDVIGRFRDTIICVECKSGRLDPARGDFQNLVQRTEALRTVLSSMGSGETSFLFFVVYDPVSNREADMVRELAPKAIAPLKPTEVRAVMARVLEGAIG